MHEVTERIEKLAWWDWPLDRLGEAVPDMQRLTIEAFLDRWEGRAPGPSGQASRNLRKASP